MPSRSDVCLRKGAGGSGKQRPTRRLCEEEHEGVCRGSLTSPCFLSCCPGTRHSGHWDSEIPGPLRPTCRDPQLRICCTAVPRRAPHRHMDTNTLHTDTHNSNNTRTQHMPHTCVLSTSPPLSSVAFCPGSMKAQKGVCLSVSQDSNTTLMSFFCVVSVNPSSFSFCLFRGTTGHPSGLGPKQNPSGFQRPKGPL